MALQRHHHRWALRYGEGHRHYLRLPRKHDRDMAMAFAALWEPLMARFGKRSTRGVNDDLHGHTRDLGTFKKRVEFWHGILNAEEIEDTPLECLLDRLLN